MNHNPTYRTAFAHIVRGHRQLLCCLWRTVTTHKLLTALILSVVANLLLLACYMQACADREHINYHAAQLTLELDSARMSNIKYRPL